MNDSKDRLKMHGLEMEAKLTPWLRFCIGMAILMLSVTPMLYVIRGW